MNAVRKQFDKNWLPEPNTGCWLWTAKLDPKGFGLALPVGDGTYLTESYVPPDGESAR